MGRIGLKLLTDSIRRATLALMARMSQKGLQSTSERRLLASFHSAALHIPAYQVLLKEHGTTPSQIRSVTDFVAHCPLLKKDNTFARFPLDQLCMPGTLRNLANIVTSSGQGGRFAFGFNDRRQAKRAINLIDLGLEYAFQVSSKRTLLINCLPMGVGFSSNLVTIAETSVREDMVVAVATQLGPNYEQIILLGDPLFLKRLTEFAEEKKVDWSPFRIHVIIGEEPFTESYRNYLAQHFGINPDDPTHGMIGSSMGVGELGMNLCYETRQTVVLRRLAYSDPVFCRALFGKQASPDRLPVLFAYNPLRTYMEILPTCDDTDYGELTISMIEPDIPVPFMRYQPGDRARLISTDDVARSCAQIGHPGVGKLPLPLIAVQGRTTDQLPDKTHLNQYKEALYQNTQAARLLTGVFRLEAEVEGIRVHVQLRRGIAVTPALNAQIGKVFSATLHPGSRVIVWEYMLFPYGMTLDYERKFLYYAPRDARVLPNAQP
jgi:phenylacetate-CoA ligase